MTYTPPEGVTIGSFTTNNLPASFRAPAGAAISYKIYGTSEGAGVATESGEPAGFKIPILNTSGVTENEFPFAEKQTITWGNGTIISDGKGNFSISGEVSGYSGTISLTEPYTIPTSVEQGGDYCFYIGNSKVIEGFSIIFYDADNNVIENWLFGSSWRKSTGYTNMTGNTITKIGFLFAGTGSRTVNVNASPMFSKNVNLTTYIPHRYTSNYDLFLGDSKLYADEYLDFDSQKVYKYVDGVLTPQDPPLPFPTISTYKGANTLSSTETLGDIELTGDWLAIMGGSTEDESIDIGFTVDAEEYIALVTVDDGPSIQVSDTITMPSSADSFSLEVVAWGREQYTDTVYNALS